MVIARGLYLLPRTSNGHLRLVQGRERVGALELLRGVYLPGTGPSRGSQPASGWISLEWVLGNTKKPSGVIPAIGKREALVMQGGSIGANVYNI